MTDIDFHLVQGYSKPEIFLAELLITDEDFSNPFHTKPTFQA